jgi:hypothetical protein
VHPSPGGRDTDRHGPASGGGSRNIEKAPLRREFDWLWAFGVGQVSATVIGYSDWGARAAPVNSSCLVTTLAAASV